jgi:hypothetical protein
MQSLAKTVEVMTSRKAAAAMSREIMTFSESVARWVISMTQALCAVVSERSALRRNDSKLALIFGILIFVRVLPIVLPWLGSSAERGDAEFSGAKKGNTYAMMFTPPSTYMVSPDIRRAYGVAR